jgi:hypothetical protein
MVSSLRYIWQLLVLSAIIVLCGILLIQHTTLSISPGVYLAMVASVTVINLISYLVMAAGISKSDQDGMVELLAGIGLKFLLYLLVILVFWVVTKNLGIDFIVTFFTLYLVFTFFLAIHLYKLLKNK